MAAAEEHPRGVFVTGTDTGVGKTLVAAALALFLRRRGIDVGVMKPVETGVEDPSTLGADGELLKWAAASSSETDLISPYRLRPPLAPSLAAAHEKIRIDPGRLRGAARALAERHAFLIVEGAGGLMVPLAGGVLMADLAKELEYPLLVVSRPDLGTINHTLLTIFAARTMEIPLAGYIINNMPQDPDLAQSEAPHALASLASADILGVLNRVEGDDRAKVEALAEQLAALPTRPWLLEALGVRD
jgi:dethiobiotin synthetase